MATPSCGKLSSRHVDVCDWGQEHCMARSVRWWKRVLSKNSITPDRRIVLNAAVITA